MDKVIKCLLLDVDNVIISQVEEVGADIGEPDCKLIKPKLVIEGKTPKERIIEWLNFTKQDVIMIRSDDVLTFVEPTKDLLDYYLSIT